MTPIWAATAALAVYMASDVDQSHTWTPAYNTVGYSYALQVKKVLQDAEVDRADPDRNDESH